MAWNNNSNNNNKVEGAQTLSFKYESIGWRLPSRQVHIEHIYVRSVQGNFRAGKREGFVFCLLQYCGHTDPWIFFKFIYFERERVGEGQGERGRWGPKQALH